jgi:hypothetical protein
MSGPSRCAATAILRGHSCRRTWSPVPRQAPLRYSGGCESGDQTRTRRGRRSDTGRSYHAKAIATGLGRPPVETSRPPRLCLCSASRQASRVALLLVVPSGHVMATCGDARIAQSSSEQARALRAARLLRFVHCDSARGRARTTASASLRQRRCSRSLRSGARTGRRLG